MCCWIIFCYNILFIEYFPLKNIYFFLQPPSVFFSSGLAGCWAAAPLWRVLEEGVVDWAPVPLWIVLEEVVVDCWDPIPLWMVLADEVVVVDVVPEVLGLSSLGAVPLWMILLDEVELEATEPVVIGVFSATFVPLWIVLTLDAVLSDSFGLVITFSVVFFSSFISVGWALLPLTIFSSVFGGSFFSSLISVVWAFDPLTMVSSNFLGSFFSSAWNLAPRINSVACGFWSWVEAASRPLRMILLSNVAGVVCVGCSNLAPRLISRVVVADLGSSEYFVNLSPSKYYLIKHIL